MPSGSAQGRYSLPAVFGGGLVFLLLTLIPYFHGQRITPPGKAFLWTHSINSGDLHAYLAQINRVRQGEILIRNSYTVDRPNRGLFRPVYLTLGLAARLAGVPALTAYHAGRIIIGGLFFVSLYLLAAEFLPSSRERSWALVLAATSSGLGWLAASAIPRNALPDLWQPEAIIFMSLYESPHFAAALALIALAVWLLLRSLKAAAAAASRPWRYLGPAAGAGLSFCLLLFDHPFDAVSMVMVAVLMLGWGWLSLGIAWGRIAAIAVCCGALAAPAPALILLTLRGDAVAQVWYRQNVLASPPFLGYLIGFGLLWPLAWVGWRSARKGGFETVLALWAALNFLLVYLPLPYQRRLAEGWHIPLVLLAASGMAGLLRRLPLPQNRSALVGGAVAAFLALGNAALVRRDVSFYEAVDPNAYVDRALFDGVSGMQKLVGREDAVLANPVFSHLVAGVTGCHVLSGQRIQSVVLPETAALLEGALRKLGEREASEFLAICADRRIRYLVFDNAWGGAAPVPLGVRFGEVVLTGSLSWPVALENAAVRVYEVPREASVR